MCHNLLVNDSQKVKTLMNALRSLCIKVKSRQEMSLNVFQSSIRSTILFVIYALQIRIEIALDGSIIVEMKSLRFMLKPNIENFK